MSGVSGNAGLPGPVSIPSRSMASPNPIATLVPTLGCVVLMTAGAIGAGCHTAGAGSSSSGAGAGGVGGSTQTSASSGGDQGGASSTSATSASNASNASNASSGAGATGGSTAGTGGSTTSSSGSGFVLGWYLQASCTCDGNYGGPGNIDAFAAWLGSPITIGSDYAAIGAPDAGAASWDNWAFPSWQSTGWQKWRVAHPGNRLVLAPGMGVVEDLAGGAAGDYDSYWKALGESLVAAGYPDAIIRIAHEFNGNWYWYQPQGMTAQFIGYWQHAVTAMRSAAGQSFAFFWNPNLGVSVESGQPFHCEDAYPGDAYVDYIGPDTYDADWGVYPMSGAISQATYDAAWQTILTQDHGLDWFVTFAAQHHKPLAVAEWGLWAQGSSYGGGDDPGYIQHMHDWFLANHVAFANYFDSGDNAIYPGSPFPNALAKFKSLF